MQADINNEMQEPDGKEDIWKHDTTEVTLELDESNKTKEMEENFVAADAIVIKQDSTCIQ